MKQLSLFSEIPPLERDKPVKKRSLILGKKSKAVGYKKYIKSYEWQKKAQAAKDLAGNKCLECGATKNLHVHHLSYENLYNEHYYDVKVLCADCHPDADQKRTNKKRYNSYLRTKFGEDAANFDDEITRAEYEDWYERKNW